MGYFYKRQGGYCQDIIRQYSFFAGYVYNACTRPWKARLPACGSCGRCAYRPWTGSCICYWLFYGRDRPFKCHNMQVFSLLFCINGIIYSGFTSYNYWCGCIWPLYIILCSYSSVCVIKRNGLYTFRRKGM